MSNRINTKDAGSHPVFGLLNKSSRHASQRSDLSATAYGPPLNLRPCNHRLFSDSSHLALLQQTAPGKGIARWMQHSSTSKRLETQGRVSSRPGSKIRAARNYGHLHNSSDRTACKAKPSNITITLLPAKLYLPSSPAKPTGLCSLLAQAGWSPR